MADATTSASTASSILGMFNSLIGLSNTAVGNASEDVSANAGENIAASDAEAKANKERMAIATKDVLQERLSAADSLQAQATSPNDPYYGRPVA